MNREAISRQRHYGRAIASAVSIAEGLCPLAASLARSWGNANSSAVEFSEASIDAKNIRSLIGTELAANLRNFASSPGTHVFIPSADAELIIAVAELFEYGSKVPKISLRLMYDDTGCHPSFPTWRSALERLSRAPRAHENILLLAETSVFANSMQKVWGRSVEVLPHPSEVFCSPPLSDAGTFNIFLPGQLRSDNGIGFVPEIAKVLLAKFRTFPKRVNLLLQGRNIMSSEFSNIKSLPRYLPTAEYQAIWQRTNLAVLLHDPKTYRLRGSGTVCDSVAGGRPFIHLVGSSLGEWNVCNNALFSEPDADSISEVIKKVITNYDRFSDAGQESAICFAAQLKKGLSTLVASSSG